MDRVYPKKEMNNAVTEPCHYARTQLKTKFKKNQRQNIMKYFYIYVQGLGVVPFLERRAPCKNVFYIFSNSAYSN